MTDLALDGIQVDGRAFAAAWLNVSVAACDDEARPILYRTVSIEVYSAGLRLTSTDGVMLLTATVDGDIELDEAPIEAVVACDADQRGRGLLAYVHKLAVAAEKNGTVDPTVTLKVAQPQNSDRPTLDPGLARRVLTISTDTESVDLDVVDAEYPAWRQLFPTGDPEPTDHLGFAAPLLARLGKLKDIETGLRFTLHGPIKAVHLSDGCELEGLIMPIAFPEDRP